jgi:hypothetical protein
MIKIKCVTQFACIAFFFHPIFFFELLIARDACRALSKRAFSVVDDIKFVEIEKKLKLPPDLSFFFADIKYTGKELKICEFGGMSTGGSWPIIINGEQEDVTPWALFWHYLTRFNKPIWYIGNKKISIIQELLRSQGKVFSTLSEFSDYYDTSCVSKKIKNTKIGNCRGILVMNQRMPYQERRKFLQEHPEILVVNSNTKRFTGKKYLFELMSKNVAFRDAMPYWGLYKKEYSPMLATQLIQEIPADFYIIKPMAGVLSKGVLMVAKEDLDTYLKLIIDDTEKISAQEYANLVYWKEDKGQSFFIQAYAPSKKITYQGKTYDPTMRVIFFLSHDDGLLSINVAAGFWKIPPQPLDAQVALTEKHITRPFLGRFFTGILVNPKDFNHIKKLLHKMLPPIYLKMLESGSQSLSKRIA